MKLSATNSTWLKECLESLEYSVRYILTGRYSGDTNDLDTRCWVSPAAGSLRQEDDGRDQQQVPGAAEYTDWSDDQRSDQAGENQVWDPHHHPCASARHLRHTGGLLIVLKTDCGWINTFCPGISHSLNFALNKIEIFLLNNNYYIWVFKVKFGWINREKKQNN